MSNAEFAKFITELCKLETKPVNVGVEIEAYVSLNEVIDIVRGLQNDRG